MGWCVYCVIQCINITVAWVDEKTTGLGAIRVGIDKGSPSLRAILCRPRPTSKETLKNALDIS